MTNFIIIRFRRGFQYIYISLKFKEKQTWKIRRLFQVKYIRHGYQHWEFPGNLLVGIRPAEVLLLRQSNDYIVEKVHFTHIRLAKLPKNNSQITIIIICIHTLERAHSAELYLKHFMFAERTRS